MSRFLFVVPPLTGHVNPTISVGRELAARGHQAAWCGEPSSTTSATAPANRPASKNAAAKRNSRRMDRDSSDRREPRKTEGGGREFARFL